MDKVNLKEVRLKDVLEALGSKKGSGNMYYSTFRRDSNPSMSVNFSKNVWYDHGAGKGGGPVDLIMATLDCDFKGALSFIRSSVNGGMHIVPDSSEEPEDDTPHGIEILSVRPLYSKRLVSYGWKRGIPRTVLCRFCREARVEFLSSGKRSLLIAFGNNAGGYVLRSTGKMKLSSKAGITTFNAEGQRTDVPSSDIVYVFEGFFDFLSWKTLSDRGEVDGDGDSVVLNSVANLGKATAFIGAHKKMVSYLDNDDAGKECLSSIEGLFPELEIDDKAVEFGESKDLNEVLIRTLKAKRSYHSHKNEKKIR